MSKLPEYPKGIPGVYVSIKDSIRDIPVKLNDLEAIRHNIINLVGEPIDFNSIIAIAREVMDHYKMEKYIDRVEQFFKLYQGTPTTVQSMIMFWIFMFGEAEE